MYTMVIGHRNNRECQFAGQFKQNNRKEDTMLQIIRKKTNDNHGTSIIFALALVLICTVVSSLIIVAAASGSNRSNQRIKQQRAYFAISSASQLLVEDLQDQGVFVGQNQAKRYGCKQYQKNTIQQKTDGSFVVGYEIPLYLIPGASTSPIITDALHLTNDIETKSVDDTQTTLNGLLGDLIEKAAAQVYQYGTAYEENFTIEVDNTETRIPKVNCKFQMDTLYNITIEVKAEGSEYSLTVNAKCSDITTTLEAGAPHSCTHAVFYKKEMENGEFVDATMNLEISGTNGLEKTTIRWGVPEVIKGVEP